VQRHLFNQRGTWLAPFLCLWALLLLLPCRTVFAAVPGTPIGNIATVSYTVSGLGSQSVVSNVEQFLVEGLGVTDKARLQVTPDRAVVFAGDAVGLDIELANLGDNLLASGSLIVRAPVGSELSIAGTRVSESSPGLFIRSLADLPPYQSVLLRAMLIPPADAASTTTPVVIEYRANGDIRDSVTVPMELRARTEAQLELLQYAPSSGAASMVIPVTHYRAADGSSVPLVAPPVPAGDGSLVTDAPLPLVPADVFQHNQILFLRLSDEDQNRDGTVRESVEVHFSVPANGEQETLYLLETTPDSGVFSGYATLAKRAMTPFDGTIDIVAGKVVQASYSDTTSRTELAEAVALVDPYGRLFDSNTGSLLDGYTVHLVDAFSGAPATVYGDDGVSRYPSTLVSGGSATDAAGNVYDFGPGEYRFPLVAPGNYRLVVVPPSGARYRWPSRQPDEQINDLPNGPFVLGVGSRGESFTLSIGPPLNLDLPLDPMDTLLFVRRTADKELVAPGDPLSFQVEIENTVEEPIRSVVLIDALPTGFRYRKGSARLDGAPILDPLISADGRQLRFSLGELPATTSHRLSYLVTVGTVRPMELASRSLAQGNGGAIRSNESRVITRIGEELMRSRVVLMGRVIAEPPEDGGEQWQGKGLAGIRLYLEDGSYAVTDEQGQYHFAGVTPGTHVLQLDLATLPPEYEVAPLEKNTRAAGRAWSRFLDLQGGSLWRADFRLVLKPREQGSVRLQLGTDPEIRDNVVRYRLKLGGELASLKNLRLMVMLPDGARYLPGSTEGEGGEPEVQGNVLTWRLADTPARWQKHLAFGIRIASLQPGKAVSTRAMLLFDTPEEKNRRSAIAKHWFTPPRPVEIARKLFKFTLRVGFDSLSTELGPDDRAMLDILVERMRNKRNIALTVVGHSDDRPITSAAGRARFGDNYRLSRERAEAVARYIMEKLAMSDLPVTIIGRGPDEPVASNDTAEGRAANRRVELYIQADEAVEALHLEKADTVTILERLKAAIMPGAAPESSPLDHDFDENWVEGAAPGLEWLAPVEGKLPAIPSVNIVIKHGFDEQVELFLDGEPVPEVNFDGTIKNRRGTVAVSRWRGVDLNGEDNRFVALIRDSSGQEIGRLERDIHFSGPPVKGVLLPEKSVLVADGVTTPVVTLRLLDRQGYPIREGSIGEYRIRPPYEAERRMDIRRAVLPGAPAQRLYYRAGKDGEVSIRLQPTTESGEVLIELPFVHGEQGIFSVNLRPRSRDWILVGMAEGTVGYNTLRGKGEPLPEEQGEHLYQEGRIAFFAKGRIKGEWLLTLAYDSVRQNSADRPYRQLDPRAWYTIYGDAGRQGVEAPSREKLYLKLERDDFYALFGDFETHLREGELSRYNRSLTGLKGRYRRERYEVVLFASESDRALVRDEIRGEGSSGPYRLSRGNVLRNSEEIVIEVRDRFQSERILERRTLTRFVDYDIDYEQGVLNLREPVFSVDAALNHIFIIARYESRDPIDRSLTWGGRAKLRVTDRTGVAFTHVEEGISGGASRLDGIDLEHLLQDQTRLRMELAQTRKREGGEDETAAALLAELKHRAERWDARLWLRHSEAGFGLNQRNRSESGTRKVGAEGGYRLGGGVTLKGKAYRNSNLVTRAERDLAELRGELTKGDTTFKLGARSVRDQTADGDRAGSDQILTGISHRTLGKRLNLRLDNEHTLGSAESIDFPDRTRLGVDYLVATATTLFAEQEWTDGAVRDTVHTRVGIKSSPWNGSEAFTTLKQTRQEGNTATTANVGLRQKWKLSKKWSLDAGAEQARVISGKSTDPLNPNVPFANAGTDDFSAASFGLTYSPGDWLWNGRVERRDSDKEDRWTLATSAQTTLQAELSLLASLRLQESSVRTGQEKRSEKFHLAMAWRPAARGWLLLNRLELTDERSLGEIDSTSQRIVNNLNSYYQATNRLQLGVQYGAKYLQETIDGEDYSGRATLLGLEGRYDIAPQWDFGLHGSLLQVPGAAQTEHSGGASIGHSFADNVWVSAGYNISGFYDKDFSSSRYTMQGPFIKFRMKFDQQSVRELVKWAGR